MRLLVGPFVLIPMFTMSVHAEDFGITPKASPPAGITTTPQSNNSSPNDTGKSGHTNVEIFTPNGPPSEPPPREFYTGPNEDPPLPARKPKQPAPQ